MSEWRTVSFEGMWDHKMYPAEQCPHCGWMDLWLLGNHYHDGSMWDLLNPFSTSNWFYHTKWVCDSCGAEYRHEQGLEELPDDPSPPEEDEHE